MRIRKAYLFRVDTAVESATLTLILAKTQMQATEWGRKPHSGKKGRLPCALLEPLQLGKLTVG